MSKDWTEERLQRSKAHPLEIVVNRFKSVESRDEFVNLVTSLSSRCLRILSVSINQPYSNGLNLPELSLPNLKHFFCTAEGACNAVEVLHMPRVLDVEIKGGIPPPESRLSGSLTVKCLSLKLYDDRCDTVDLIDFLQSLPNLDELHLDLDDRTCGYNRRENRNPTGGTPPNVRFLYLETGVPRIFSEIIGHLDMPTLEKLHLRVLDYTVNEENEGYVTAREWVDLIPLDRHESVKELKFSFWHASRENSPVGELLRSFPTLRMLDLDITENEAVMKNSRGRAPNNIPPLRSFSISREAVTDVGFLTAFVDIMGQNDRWEDFECLNFTRGHLVSREEVERILTRRRLHWSD